MLVFLALYLWHDGTRQMLVSVSDLKREAGYAFAFVSYVIAAAVLPELMRVVFFQRGRIHRINLSNVATAAPFWGLIGMSVDLLYRLQVVWFGPGNDLVTIVLKVFVDQFLYSPFISAPLIVGFYAWRDAGFRREVLGEMLNADFVATRIFPVVVAGWCVWIPGVSLVYFMPSLLQLPVAVLIQVFWILILTTVSERRPVPPDLPSP